MEEPPAHALFILATTEPEKIPATILSRAQRFTFFRLKEEAIQGELARILDLEKRSYTDEGLAVIAAHSDGSMRDSLSILDQVLSVDGGVVDGELVRGALGLTEEEGIFRIVDGLFTGDGGLIVDALNRAYDRGRIFLFSSTPLSTTSAIFCFTVIPMKSLKASAKKKGRLLKAMQKTWMRATVFGSFSSFNRGGSSFATPKIPKPWWKYFY